MKNAIILGTIAAAMAGAAWQPALAADLAPAPVYTKAAPVDTWSPWELRVRALGVLPDASGSTVNVIGFPGLSSPNSGLKIGNSVVPELDISYFFSKNLAAELILGVTPHHITGTGALAGLDIGKTWLLPPTLLVQYHFTNFGAFQPYVGVGVNYTAFFSTSAANAGGPLSVTSLGVGSTFGAAAQVGFDYMIDRHWGLNFDVKKLYLEPKFDATVNNVIAVNGRANINPWLIGGGVAYKF
ncbi:MAG: OmpW family protein [Xanthobacteraceae bacterium]|nr:OmpW family protein [Xanthobacteraceae bacterium]